jgi:hypothetical protein
MGCFKGKSEPETMMQTTKLVGLEERCFLSLKIKTQPETKVKMRTDLRDDVSLE